MKAINLKTEYLINPIGIDIQKPRIMWNCEGGVKQTAYRIIAACDDSIVWDSDKVGSDIMCVELPIVLKSRQRIILNVTLWDENGKDGESAEAYFETGLLLATDWKAKWISGNYKVNKKKRYPVDCFLKKFTAENVAKARLYATACGIYTGQINGNRIEGFVLAPGHTDYRKRIQYQTYDVTELLRNGENRISFELADGWYRGSTGAWGIRNQYGTQTKLLAQLEITDKDGNVTVISTDKSWAWSNDGEIIFADNKDGEIVDARKAPTYSGKATETKNSIVPVSSNNVPVLEHERLAVKRVIKTPSGKTVLDFGQNIAGYIEFTVNAKAGQKLKMRFGEMIDDSGEFTQRNIQCGNKKGTRISPLQKIEYTAKDGVNAYKTKFAIFGFQYVLIETDIEYSAEDFTAIAVYSDIAQTGFFESSNEILNKFVDCTLWSTKNNSADVPTDCPTRERHGWTGDSQIFFGTASYLFDYATFAKKHLNDVYDWQEKNGRLPQIAPYGGVDFYMATMNGCVGWADAGILIPYRFWKKYGDIEILKTYYEGMKKYARFMIKRCGRKTILSKPLHLKRKYRKYAVNYGQSYGEWAEPADVHPNKWTDMVFTHPEESTAYTSYVLGLMAEIAHELGKTEDERHYRFYSDKVKEAYRELRKTEKFTLDTNRQAQLVRPLYMDLLDKEQTEYARKRLVKALEDYGWRVGTGFLSTAFIMDVLTDIDPEYAYKLIENEQMPGWLFMPKTGATTVWESWEGTQAQGGIASLNHYSKGSVCEWLFNSMCGINVGTKPATFVIKPVVGGSFKYAKASYRSVYGTVESGWERNGEKTVYTIKIPCNCTAEIVLPNETVQTVGTGEYRWTEKNQLKELKQGKILV